MSGYTKLFNSILASTIWREPNHVRVVWITMLAMANKHGLVEASVPGLADIARVTLAECEQALEALLAPDPYSRTPEHEGRRIKAVPGGFLLLNHAKYRDQLSAEDRREYQRHYMADYRAQGKDKSRVVNTGKQMLGPVKPGKSQLAGLGHTDPSPSPDPNTHTDQGVSVLAQKREFEAENRIGWLRAELGRLYNRPRQGVVGSCMEESLLANVARHPDVKGEVATIIGYWNKLPSKQYFPHSLARLLESWQETLDKARVFQAPRDSASLAEKEALRLNKIAHSL